MRNSSTNQHDAPRRARVSWTGWGALFGVCFPLLALGIRAHQLGFQGALSAFLTDPLLWIIATAPVFLGAFAYLGGVQQDGVRALSAGLERKVEERTASLSALLRRVQAITDGIADGVVTVSLDGSIQHASSVATQWLGEPAGAPVWQWLFPDDEGAAQMFELGLEDIAADLLPFEVIAEQVPRHLERDGRALRLDLRQVGCDGGQPCLLIVLRDMTAAIEAERAQRESQELQAVFAHILRDGQAWQRFRTETEQLIDAACGALDATERMRALHTLKGNAAIFGLVRFAEVCHNLETALQEPDEAIAEHLPSRLQETWSNCQSAISHLLPPAPEDEVRVRVLELEALLGKVRAGVRHEVLERDIELLSQPAIGSLFERLTAEARRLSGRLCKQVKIEVEGEGVRAPESALAALGPSLVHAVRNALDHGIEAPDVRLAHGKAPAGRLTLRAAHRGAHLEITIEDDGAGVDTEALARIARARGVAIPDDPLELMFIDGLSFKEQATEISGRGVGMAALRAACRGRGGDAAVRTTRGGGTRVDMTIALCEPPLLADRALPVAG